MLKQSGMLLSEYLLGKPELKSLLKQSEMLLLEYLLGKPEM